MESEIYDLLYRLGMRGSYTGFYQTAYAIKLSVEQPERLLLVTKWLYPEVAKRYGTNWKAVERNIRTAGSIIWRENRGLLEELTGRAIREKPGGREVVAVLAEAIKREGPQARSSRPEGKEEIKQGCGH